jgi:pimeloyl-ACP methyl ester carboxylesterase
MHRRTVLRWLGSMSVATGAPVLSSRRLDAQAPPWPSLTVHGNERRPALVIANGGNTTFTAGAIGPLVDRYRVILMELGQPPSLPPEEYTADRVCAAILTAATGAGVDRFAWYGYSFGAVMGLQLATRTDRVSALICGGWPPIGAQYRDTLAVSEARAARGEDTRHVLMFYRSIQGWPEREAVTKLTCPRMAFAGTDDRFDVDGQAIRIGPTLSQHKPELQRLGWTVELVPGFGHELGGRRDVVVPLVRTFMDALRG